MIVIYRNEPSDGAVALAQRIRELGYDAKKWSYPPLVRAVERNRPLFVVGWGHYHRIYTGAGLNLVAPISKYQELAQMRDAGVRTVEFLSRANLTGSVPLAADDTDYGNWVMRRTDHSEAYDITPESWNDWATGYYLTRWTRFQREIRIHIFNGLSIRAGLKVPRDVGVFNPNIRSGSTGWGIRYSDNKVRMKDRDLARQAVAALGLDFAAVDIGVLPDGEPVVLEVNRAPGLEGNTIDVYARAIVARAEA